MKTVAASFYYQNNKPNGFAFTIDVESFGEKEFKKMLNKFDEGCKAAKTQTEFSSFEALKQLENKVLENRRSASIEVVGEFIFLMGFLIERNVIKQDEYNGTLFQSIK